MLRGLAVARDPPLEPIGDGVTLIGEPCFYLGIRRATRERRTKGNRNQKCFTFREHIGHCSQGGQTKTGISKNEKLDNYRRSLPKPDFRFGSWLRENSRALSEPRSIS